VERESIHLVGNPPYHPLGSGQENPPKSNSRASSQASIDTDECCPKAAAAGERYVERLGPTGKARTIYRCGERGLRPKG
jgi:hypothetical protein